MKEKKINKTDVCFTFAWLFKGLGTDEEKSSFFCTSISHLTSRKSPFTLHSLQTFKRVILSVRHWRLPFYNVRIIKNLAKVSPAHFEENVVFFFVCFLCFFFVCFSNSFYLL